VLNEAERMSGEQKYLGWTIDYRTPAGAPAFSGPDSVSWQIYKNPIALAIGGICAVLLEFADPRIRSGVWDHSIFKQDPLGRAQRTGTAAMVGTYGPQEAARRVIQGVNNMHARVQGTTPNGIAYDARDTELLDWVSATARYGFVMAYHHFVKPLSDDDMQRYFKEGEVVAGLYGVKTHVRSLADFDSMMHALEPYFEAHEINSEFLEIMRSGRATDSLPKSIQTAIAHAAIDILPPMVREKLQLGAAYDLTLWQRWLVRRFGQLSDWLPDRNSPAAQACERLGLPANFLWLSQGRRHRLLGQLNIGGVI